MSENYKKILDWFLAHWALATIFSGTAIVAASSAFIASGVEWLDQYGAIAWWFAALLGALIAIWVLGGVAWLRFKWIAGSAIRKWNNQVDEFNPLAREFNALRMRISDIVNPVTNKVENKRIVDCELIGPANILFIGGSEVISVGFIDCDIVLAHPNTLIRNVVAFEDVKIVGGKIFRATIFISDAHLEMFKAMGATFVSRTGDPEIDNQPQG